MRDINATAGDPRRSKRGVAKENETAKCNNVLRRNAYLTCKAIGADDSDSFVCSSSFK